MERHTHTSRTDNRRRGARTARRGALVLAGLGALGLLAAPGAHAEPLIPPITVPLPPLLPDSEGGQVTIVVDESLETTLAVDDGMGDADTTAGLVVLGDDAIARACGDVELEGADATCEPVQSEVVPPAVGELLGPDLSGFVNGVSASPATGPADSGQAAATCVQVSLTSGLFCPSAVVIGDPGDPFEPTVPPAPTAPDPFPTPDLTDDGADVEPAFFARGDLDAEPAASRASVAGQLAFTGATVLGLVAAGVFATVTGAGLTWWRRIQQLAGGLLASLR